MSEIKFSYISNSSEECKNLEEAFSWFSHYFRLDTSKANQTIFVQSTPAMIRNLESKFVNLNKTQGIMIYPEKENSILRICREDSDRTVEHPIFWFDSSKTGLSIGLKPKDDKYLFEVYYENPDFKKDK